MTIPALIDQILGRLDREHYRPGSPSNPLLDFVGLRIFMRDKPALTKAVARYGYECHRRGWEFDSAKLYTELTALLDQIRQTNADIRYLPRYLESAIDRSIRLEADRLNEDWKRDENGRAVKAKHAQPPTRVIPAIIARLTPSPGVIVREPSGAEILASLYQEQRRLQQQRKQAKRETAKTPRLL